MDKNKKYFLIAVFIIFLFSALSSLNGSKTHYHDGYSAPRRNYNTFSPSKTSAPKSTAAPQSTPYKRSYGSSKKSSSSKTDDPYDVNGFSNAEDFYDEHYDDFFDYYDAESYYDDHYEE